MLPAAMRNLQRSSAGTAQRNQQKGREGRRKPQEEGWQKVQGKRMKGAYEEIERMAETLRRLVDEVTYLQQQGRETYRKNNRDPNPWSPLAPKAARRRTQSIGDQSVDARDQERGRTAPRRSPRRRSPQRRSPLRRGKRSYSPRSRSPLRRSRRDTSRQAGRYAPRSDQSPAPLPELAEGRVKQGVLWPMLPGDSREAMV